MLTELRVAQLGVIEDADGGARPGHDRPHGETGAGKTLIVDAIALLLRGPGRRHRGAAGGDRGGGGGALRRGCARRRSWCCAEPSPPSGRGRAYLDGHMASGPHLAELGEQLVDLHGQHAHQSLLHPAAQRRALDAGGRASAPRRWRPARRAVRELMPQPGRTRRRRRAPGPGSWTSSATSWRELDAARAGRPDRGRRPAKRGGMAVGCGRPAQAAGAVADGLAADEGIVDRLGSLVATLAGRTPLAALHDRLLGLQTELSDLASEARSAAEDLRGRPAAAGRDRRPPSAADRAAAQVRRHPGRSHRVPGPGPERG